MKLYLSLFLFFSIPISAMEEDRTVEAGRGSPSLLMKLPNDLIGQVIRFTLEEEKIGNFNNLLCVSTAFKQAVSNHAQRLTFPKKTIKPPLYIIGDQGLEAIGKIFTNLCVLKIGIGAITDSGIAHLASLTHLKELSLGFHIRITLPYKGPMQITDNGFRIISKLPQLTHLTLECTCITSESIQYIPLFPSLTFLNLSNNNLRNKKGGHWASLKGSQLENLYLRGTQLKRKDMRKIATLPLLNLDLRDNSLYATHLKFFSRMTFLEQLLLSNIRTDLRELSIHCPSDLQTTYGSYESYLATWEASRETLISKLDGIVKFI